MRSSLIKTLILSGILRCLTASNNLWNELCSSKEVVSAEIITCLLIIRDFTDQQRRRLIHRDPQTHTHILLSRDESTGSLIWAQITPKQAEKCVCVFTDEADWMIPLRQRSFHTRQDPGCMCFLLKGPAFLQRDPPSCPPTPPIQKSTRRSI